MEKPKKQKEDISAAEADNRLKNMSSLSKEPKDAFAIERLRAKYKDEIEKNDNNRIISRIYHSQGEQERLNQHSVKENDQIYKDRVSKLTEATYSKAKAIYRSHGVSASNTFSKSKLKDVLKSDFKNNKQPSEKSEKELSDQFNRSKVQGKLKFDFDKYKAQSKAKEQDNNKSLSDKNKGLDMGK